MIEDARHTTIPALIMNGLATGIIPTSEKLDALTAFASSQHLYYRDTLRSGASSLGPYEALGRGFADTQNFQSKYEAGSSAEFIARAYQDIFGSAPTAAQHASLFAQVSYFEQLYASAGESATVASIHARGAVFGQIVGYAAVDSAEPYAAKAAAILTGVANGDASAYGATFGG